MSPTPSERRAKALLKARREAGLRAGTWQPFLPDPGPVRDRVSVLRAAGYSVPALAAAASVSTAVIDDLLVNPGHRLTQESGRRLLGLRLDPRGLPGTVLVAPHGTRRRVDALAVEAWDYPSLSREAGAPPHMIANLCKAARLTAASAAVVADLHDRLWCTPGPSEVSRRRAVAAGKHGWWAWDEETIDDPAAVPALEGPPSEDAWLEDAADLAGWGVTLDAAAARLGRASGAALEQALRRAKRQDLIDALKANGARRAGAVA